MISIFLVFVILFVVFPTAIFAPCLVSKKWKSFIEQCYRWVPDYGG